MSYLTVRELLEFTDFSDREKRTGSMHIANLQKISNEGLPNFEMCDVIKLSTDLKENYNGDLYFQELFKNLSDDNDIELEVPNIIEAFDFYLAHKLDEINNRFLVLDSDGYIKEEIELTDYLKIKYKVFEDALYHYSDNLIKIEANIMLNDLGYKKVTK